MSNPYHGPSCVTRTYPLDCYNCKQKIFVFSCTCGSRILFEELGKPWPLHNCFVDVSQLPPPPQINNIITIAKDVEAIETKSHGREINCIGVVREVGTLSRRFSNVNNLPDSPMALEMLGIKRINQPMQITIEQNENGNRYSYTGIVDKETIKNIERNHMVIVSMSSVNLNGFVFWYFQAIDHIRGIA